MTPSCVRRANYTDVGSGPRGRRSEGAGGAAEETGEQQHLDASIIYKTPAATKAERDQNQQNRIA